jgi:hypothetical protein
LEEGNDMDQGTVQIVAGILAVLCVVAIIMRRKSKASKPAGEDDF